MKKHIRYGIVLISLILSSAFFLYLLNSIIPFSENLHVREGVIHISPEEGESWGARLQGEWEFYWEELLTFHDLQSRTAAQEFGEVPMVWNRYNGEEKHPGFGYATYVVEVSGVTPGKQLGLIVPTTSTANKVFIDDVLVHTTGSVSNSAALHIPSYKTGFFPFVANNESFHIIIQVSNFVYARGGLWHEPILGEYQTLKGYHDRLRQKDYFLLGGLLIMVLFHLLVFGFDHSDRSHLYLALLALNALVRILVSGNYRIYDFTSIVCFRFMFIVEYISFHWIATTFLLLSHTLFQKGRKNVIIKGVVVNALLLSVYTIIIPIRFVSAIINYAQISVLFSLFYGLFIAFKALLRSERGAGIIFVCGYLGTIMSLFDILFYNNLVKSYLGETTSFAIFISILIQSSVIAVRFALNTRRLQKLSGELIRLSVLKDEFLVNTSHELKTPLSSIIALSDSLLMGGTKTISPVQLEAASLIRTSARRLSHTVNDVLDIVKLRNEDLSLAIRALDLNRVYRSILGMFSILAIPKGLKIQTDIPDTLPLVLADENRLAQILYNLMDNALKHTDNGIITITAESIDSFVNVSITDTGRGIDAALLDAILNVEMKEEKYLFTQGFASGIGLALSRYLIETQGGRMWAESRIGYGSSFHFSLPAAEMLNDPEIQQVLASTILNISSPIEDFMGNQGESAFTSRPQNSVENPIIGRGKSKSPHVLVVGDDYINIRSAVALLRQSGYEVSTAFNGGEAVGLINSYEGFSLVILDVMMAGLSGYETTKIIRENKSLIELPLLMMTARHWGEDILKSLEAGANDYLPKPFETEEFLARVQTLLEMKNSADKALRAEMAFLQAQIKPHFLFNSLNTIISFCDSEPNKASKLLLHLSRYLWMSFDLKALRSFIPFFQELEVIKAYISLEKARFKSGLEMVYDIDHSLQFKLPPLILQPLVENAVVHGIRKKSGKGQIILRVKKLPAEKRIFICVEDNGIGVTEDKLKNILVTGRKGIGLWNINWRLKRIYQTELILASKPQQGFTASFNIPLQIGEDYNA